jgi:hypothetical protein
LTLFQRGSRQSHFIQIKSWFACWPVEPSLPHTNQSCRRPQGSCQSPHFFWMWNDLKSGCEVVREDDDENRLSWGQSFELLAYLLDIGISSLG